MTIFFRCDLEGPKTHSRMIINNVIKEDSGKYSCSAPNTEQSSIDVFVSPGLRIFEIFSILCVVSLISEKAEGPILLLLCPPYAACTANFHAKAKSDKWKVSDLCLRNFYAIVMKIYMQPSIKCQRGKVSWIREQGQVYELLIKGEKSGGGDCGSMVTPLSFNH